MREMWRQGSKANQGPLVGGRRKDSGPDWEEKCRERPQCELQTEDSVVWYACECKKQELKRL